jgi:hypothetical protein
MHTCMLSSHALQGLLPSLPRSRLPWRDVVNGPKYVGDLISEQVLIGDERYNMISLRSAEPMVPSPIPPPYEPVLLGFFTLAFRLRGFESVNRGTSSFGVVQEWHCELP